MNKRRAILLGLAYAILLLFAPAALAQSNRWWALRPLVPSPVPAVKGLPAPAPNPIDAFVSARLAEHGLELFPEAPRRTLVRRLYFDLTGLPPTPAEIQAFLEDRSADAYEKVVTRLLSSPRYGERWARHWIDIAHFAETHGHDQDRIRTNAWPYRDYLVRSFNDDKPYGRFIAEQVAGDVLFPDDPAATVALGFLASGPWDESSLRDIREDTADRQIARYLDRDDMLTTVMQTFTSTTVQCARCHDHKFDPVTQQDYYALQAVFAGVDRADRVYDLDPAVHRRRQQLISQRKKLEHGDPAGWLSPESESELQAWARDRARAIEWTLLDPQTFVSTGGAVLAKQSDGSILASGPRPERDTYQITARPVLEKITAIRLELLTNGSLPHQGPGRQDNGNMHLSEVELQLFEAGASQARPVPLAHPSADFNQSGWTIAQAIDGDEKTAWGIHPRVGQAHQAVFELKEALAIPPGSTLVFSLKQLHGEGHLIGQVRLSVTSGAAELAAILPSDIQAILATPAAQRSEEQRIALARFYLGEKVASELAALPKPAFIYAAASDFAPNGSLKPSPTPRPVYLLRRGELQKPGEAAVPGAISSVTELPARFELKDPQDEGTRRAALAGWLCASNNPLVWRSIVNRAWHYHFGRGLVDTPNDFGRMGSGPSHPELLDWLAIWFRDQGGGFKSLDRLIVTSAVYRQASSVAEAQETVAANRSPRAGLPEQFVRASSIDMDNRLLWRMNRTRLDAEQIRDTVLQIAGCLDLRMGGPSDRQFDLQPGPHVTPRVDYAKFDPDGPAGRRRSIYRFLFRTLPDPFMDALDCPAGDQLVPARNSSVTVQQALAMWNDAFMVHYAGRFASHLSALAPAPKEQLTLASELALGRPPTPGELDQFESYRHEHGLANFCRLLLNCNEFIYLN